MGRASTPPVKDHGRAIRTIPVERPEQGRWPVLVVGDAPELTAAGIDVWHAHPNSLGELGSDPSVFRALVVDCRELAGLWAGALSGSSQWKAEVVYQACVAWRSAGLPVYVVRPAVETVPSYRWTSASTATFPWPGDDAEETGNPRTVLWRTLEKLGERQ